MKKPVDVYLAGGMKSGWQDVVKERLKDLKDMGFVRWSDPRNNGTSDPSKYKLLDKIRWETADIVFGYAEETNPSLFALGVELAGGHYSGAKTILVNLPENEPRYRYFSFVTVVCDYVTNDLDDGIEMLRKMIKAFSFSESDDALIE